MADRTELVNLVTGRQGKLEQKRAGFESEWQEIADYVINIREDLKGVKAGGERQGSKVYDGTAVGAAILATDGIHGYHVSPAFTWFMYAMARKELDRIHEVRQWLQEVEYCIYSALNASNFYDEMWQYIYDGLTIGTATVYMEEDLAEGKLVFETVHPGEVYIAENRYGEIDILHRKRKLSHRIAVSKFGEDNVPELVKNSYKKNPFDEAEYLHAVFPRQEWDDRKKDAKSKKYASVWTQGNHLCLESGYDNFQYSVWRYMKSGKEAYGRSPASMALSDILGLNLMSKTLLGAAQMAVDPPLNVPSDMMGKVQWHPRGKNPYDDANKTIRPATTGINFPIGVDREERKQKIIEQHFNVDFFLMLAKMEGRGQRTAYEVSKLQEEKAAVLGAELAPLNKQLDKILDWVFDTEMRAGRLPQPPDILMELQGERFDPVYMGPLAQAQRRLFGTQGIRAGLEAITPMINLKPEIADMIDFDETTRLLLESSGFPQSAIISKEKLTQMRDERSQVQAQEQATGDMLNMAEGVKKAASADKDMGGGLQKLIAGAMGGGNESA